MMKHLFSFLIIVSFAVIWLPFKKHKVIFSLNFLNKRRKAILYLKNTLKK